MKKNGVGTLVPSNNIEKNGTKVPPPRRKFLPHIDMIGYYQFLTFRTFDSLDDFVKKIRLENISTQKQVQNRSIFRYFFKRLLFKWGGFEVFKRVFHKQG